MRGSAIVVVVSLALGCGNRTASTGESGTGSESGNDTESGDEESTTGDDGEPTWCERVLDPSIYPQELVWEREPVVADESCPASGPPHVVQLPAPVVLTGTVAYGGNPGGGKLELLGCTDEGSVDVEVTNGSFAAEVLAGCYDVILHPDDTGTDIYISTTIAEDLQIAAPLVLPIDLPVVTVSGAMTMDGQLAPDDFAWLSIPVGRSSWFQSPDSHSRKMLHMIEGSYSVTATPGIYQLHYDSCDPTVDLEACYIADHPPLPPFPLGPNQRIVPLSTFEVGSEDLQLDIDVPTVTVAGTISLDGQPTTGYLEFRKDFDHNNTGNGIAATDGVFSERWVAAQYDQVVLYTTEEWSDLEWGDDYYASALVPELENIDADVNLDLARTSASVTMPSAGPEQLVDPHVLGWLDDVWFDIFYPGGYLLGADWPSAEALPLWPGVRGLAIVGHVCWPDFEPEWNASRFVAIMLNEELELSGEVEFDTVVADELAAVHVDLLLEGQVGPYAGLGMAPIARPPATSSEFHYESFPGPALSVHGYFPRGPAIMALEGVPIGVVDIQDGTTVRVQATFEPVHYELQVDGESVSIEHLYTAEVSRPNFHDPVTDSQPPGRYLLIYGSYLDDPDPNDGLPDNEGAVIGCLTREG